MPREGYQDKSARSSYRRKCPGFPVDLTMLDEGMSVGGISAFWCMAITFGRRLDRSDFSDFHSLINRSQVDSVPYYRRMKTESSAPAKQAVPTTAKTTAVSPLWSISLPINGSPRPAKR